MKKWIMSHEFAFDVAVWVIVAIQIATLTLGWAVFKKGTMGYNVVTFIWIISVPAWFFAMALSAFASSLKLKERKPKYLRPRIEAFDWSEFNHDHFCIAAQLLNDTDFELVCPHGGNVEFIGTDDACDYCKYSATIDFNTDSNGKKYIDLYIDDKILPKNNEVVE